MKFDITYSCGHTATMQLYGPYKERERRIDYLSNYCVCPECKARERDEKAAAILAADAENGLPELTGSEKQIKWAAQIRDTFNRKVMAEVDKAASRGASPEQIAAVKAQVEDIIAFASNAHTSAAWWIDNRFGTWLVIAEEYEAARQ